DEIRYGWKFVQREDRLRSPRRQQYGAPVDCDWPKAYEIAATHLKQIVDEGGRLALLVSPMLSCEEAYLLGKLVTALDPQAMLGVGPVPIDGEDKTFPGGYTIYAEKAPNARGVRRALKRVADDVLEFDAFVEKLGGASAAIITGNYPDAWTSKPLVDALRRKFTMVIATLPNDLTPTADVLVPGAT